MPGEEAQVGERSAERMDCEAESLEVSRDWEDWASGGSAESSLAAA